MTDKKLLSQLKKRNKQFARVWQRTVNDMNTYLETHETVQGYQLNTEIENLADYMALSGAWLYDRSNGKQRKDKGSMTGKIRKALGFTY